ncbi:hypothetical protein HDU78_002649 [Chytriomyces hyalinus]|nr:hypothetical protein HDU78_002649 [Chytriomyces hyalinus]
MVATRSKRNADSLTDDGTVAAAAPAVASKKARTSSAQDKAGQEAKRVTLKAQELELAKSKLKKVSTPSRASTLTRVPHPKTLQATKSKLKKVQTVVSRGLELVPHPAKLSEVKSVLKTVTPVVKTNVVVLVDGKASPAVSPVNKKAMSSPARSPARAVSPVGKRPLSADGGKK